MRAGIWFCPGDPFITVAIWLFPTYHRISKFPKNKIGIKLFLIGLGVHASGEPVLSKHKTLGPISSKNTNQE
jgi:hypothetical protein